MSQPGAYSTPKTSLRRILQGVKRYIKLEKSKPSNSLVFGSSFGGSGSGSEDYYLTVEELDGIPSAVDVIKLIFPNGAVTDLGSGVVQITFSSSEPCSIKGMYQVLLTSETNLSDATYIDDNGNVQVVENAVLQTVSECADEFDWWNRNRTSRAVIADGHECLLLHDMSHVEGIFTWELVSGVWTPVIRDSIIIPGWTADDPPEPDGTKLIAVTVEASTVTPEGFRLKPISWGLDETIELSQICVNALI